MRRPRHLLSCILAVAMLLAASGCVVIINPEDLSERVQKQLTVTQRTEHFDVFARPDTQAARHQRRIAAAAEKELARICADLAVANDTRFSLFLFEDAGDLARSTGVPAGGFTSGRAAYVIYGDLPARVHEMVHLVTEAKVLSGSQRLFLVEGLANALLGPLPGREVHAVAWLYRKTGRLPRVAEVTGDTHFYKWIETQPPGFNAYEVAASWMRFLIDTQGIRKTKQYYISGDTLAAFGQSVDALETAWWALLDGYKPSPAMEVQVVASDGRSVERLTRVEGESLRVRNAFRRLDASSARVGLFFDEKELPDEPAQPEFGFGWTKDGRQIESAGRSLLEFEHLTVEDSGVYVGATVIRPKDAAKDSNNAVPINGQVFLLTVVPKHEVDPSR